MKGRAKIYTKTGDNGKTSLYGGKRVFKDDCLVAAYGGVDELNCFLGLVICKFPNRLKEKEILYTVQDDLMAISSNLAGIQLVDKSFLPRRIAYLEKEIDSMEKEIPALKNFIIPGGSEVSSLLHVARAVCRRVERGIVTLSKKTEINGEILKYINRLSDLLFVMARYENKKRKIKDNIWLFEKV